MNRNLRLLGIGAGIRTFGNALYFPFLALFLHNVLAVGYGEIGIIISGIGLLQLPFNYLGGLLTDRVGRRNLILWGLGAEVATTAAFAYSFAIESLTAAIVVAAIGASLTTLAGPASQAYVADFAEGSERTRGYTFVRIGFNAGFAAGVALGGVLISSIGFAGSVAIAAVIIASGTIFLGLTLEPSPRDRALAEQRGPTASRGPPASDPPGRGVAESFRILARHRVALELLVAVVFASLVMGQWSVTFPLYVNNVLGIPYAILGIGLALNGVIVVFGQSATTERMIGHRHTTIAVLGMGLYVVAFLALGVAGLLLVAPIIAFFVSVIVLTFGENLVAIPQTTLPSNLAPTSEVGSYNGAFQLAGGIGFIAAVLLGGAVLAATSNPLVTWLLLVLPAIPSILLFRHAARRLTPQVDRA